MQLRTGNPAVLALAFVLLTCAAFAADLAANRAAEQRDNQTQQVAPAIVVYSRETFVDIVVTDAQGHPIHGLKPSDFTILEDGKPMTPKSFAEHRTDEAPAVPVLAKQDLPHLPPNTFTNLSPAPPSNLPINIILLDSLNTPMQVQQFVQQQMLLFIKNMQPGTRVAVFRLTTHLAILQGLTTDPELLKAAINDKRNAAQTSGLQDPGQDVMEVSPSSDVRTTANLMAARAEDTLSAMRQIARYFSGMPGHKNLIWFTGSFPLTWPPKPPDPHIGLNTDYEVTDDMKSATDLLAREHIAIYSMDGRLQKSDITPVRDRERLEEHYNMDLMAEQTGGKAFYRTNDLAGAVKEAIDSGSNFYMVTYTPTNPKLDTRYRKITVKVNQRGLKLTYREGYYAVDPGVDAHGKKVVPNANAMQTAMLRGALEPTQIVFKVKVAPTAATEVALPTNNEVDAKRMKPPYKKLTVAYATDIHDITFKPAGNGQVHADFEFAVMVYDGDGQVVNSSTVAFHPTLATGRYQTMLRTGLNSQQEIAVPAKGEYILRIAVHDLASDRVGAVEVPGAAIVPETVPALAGK